MKITVFKLRFFLSILIFGKKIFNIRYVNYENLLVGVTLLLLSKNRILYSGLSFIIKTMKLMCNIEIRGHFLKKVTKIIKRVKDDYYRERLEKLRLTPLLKRRMRDVLIDTFKILKYLIMVDIFS